MQTQNVIEYGEEYVAGSGGEFNWTAGLRDCTTWEDEWRVSKRGGQQECTLYEWGVSIAWGEKQALMKQARAAIRARKKAA